MRTTVRLNPALLQRAKKEAARRGSTLTALIEAGLEIVLTSPARRSLQRVSLPVCSQGGGTLPGVDLNDGSELLDRMGEA